MNKFVLIDEKRQPISFNMAAYYECEEWLDLPIITLLSQHDSIEQSKYMKLAYLGLKYGCDEFERKTPMTYSAFAEMVSKPSNHHVLTDILKIVFKDIETVMTIQAEQFKMFVRDSETVETKKKKPSGRTTSGA